MMDGVMNVVDQSIAGLPPSSLALGNDRTGRTALLRLAIAFTSAAAVAGLVEVLVDRIAAPAMAGALGPSAATVTTVFGWVGTLAVSVTAVLVLLTVSAWSVHAWDRHMVFALAAMTAVVASVIAGLSSSRTWVFVVHASVSVAAAAYLAIGARRASLPYLGALWAVALAVVAGQWSLSGLGNGPTLTSRAVGEAALVLAVVFLAIAVSRSSHGRLAPLLGLAAGAGLATVSLASDYTPFVALWATGAMLWLPSLVYVGAAAAAGYVLATGVSDRTTRHLSVALILLLVAGVEPTLVHHNATALLALVALGAQSATEGDMSWQ
jgi:hypothetical protein